MITVPQVRAFMDAVNAGRTAYGLEPISELEFDDCKPSNNTGCLSARHLICPIGGRSVMDTEFVGVPDPPRLAAAIGSETVTSVQFGGEEVVVIPPPIREVTDEFDRLPRVYEYEREYAVDLSNPEVKEFRLVLVEAGVVKD